MVVTKKRGTVRAPLGAGPRMVAPAEQPRDERMLRVLHVLGVSVPHINGYTVRSKYIVDTQRKEGYEPVVVTSPFYPGNPASLQGAVIDGTPYYRVPHPTDLRGPSTPGALLCRRLHRLRGFLRAWQRRRLTKVLILCPRRGVAAVITGLMTLFPKGWVGRIRSVGPSALSDLLRRMTSWAAGLLQGIEEVLLLRWFERELLRVARRVRPDVLHAHSPYRCGVPALRVAWRLGIPLVYEVRGVWEESGVAAGRFKRGGPRYQYWRRRDTEVMRQADAVVCICEQLRQEVIRRGVAPQRVFVVPNAVDTSVFHPPSPSEVDAQAAASAGFQDVRRRLRFPTLGYVGSIRRLEGVEELVRGAAEVVRRGYEVSLLVVGRGPGLDGLRRLAQEEGIGDRTVFTGSVPHEQVSLYYSLLDVFVISRPALRVTKLVTPLKPLEAMAMGKALITSDLPALREIVKDGETGLLYRPGDVGDLAEKCIRLLDDRAFQLRLAEAGRRWVEKERTWSVSLRGLRPAYRAARSRAARAQTASTERVA